MYIKIIGFIQVHSLNGVLSLFNKIVSSKYLYNLFLNRDTAFKQKNPHKLLSKQVGQTFDER